LKIKVNKKGRENPPFATSLSTIRTPHHLEWVQIAQARVAALAVMQAEALVRLQRPPQRLL